MHCFGSLVRGLQVLTSVLLVSWSTLAWGQSLQDELQKAGSAALAGEARAAGDAQRGALVFFQRHLACAKCHVSGHGGQALGPDLSSPHKDTTAESIVESILEPSKVIRQGFESVSIQTKDGRSLSGLIAAETPVEVTLKVFGSDVALTSIPISEIDERVAGKLSLMPANQANQLANRQQFLDLVKYLIEITEGGASRARELRPPESLLVLQVPEYERDLDHAGLIRGLNRDSLKRGEAIYQRLCINCHGTATQPGSLPTSLKFGSGQFKNGSDPYRLYQTLTYGVGMMAPQTWMVPQQKYDVIHYIREEYLKPLNPKQYVAIDEGYLKRLPPGKTRGPAPTKIEPWATMNYGAFLTATYEVPEPFTSGPLPNIAQKGIAVRLDSGPGGVSRGQHWMVFDHDTLRMVGSWSRSEKDEQAGFINWNGINFNGQHQIHPRVAGQVELSTNPGPGWASPGTRSWKDVRVLGRDGRQYGPLPKSWGKYRGLYQYGERVVLWYSIGDTSVLEMPGMTTFGQRNVFTRNFNIGPRPEPLVLKVASVPGGANQLKLEATGVEKGPARFLAQVYPRIIEQPPTSSTILFEGSTRVEIENSKQFDLTGSDYSITARIRAMRDGTIFAQMANSGPWVPNAKALFVRGGRLCFDIGWVGVVTSKTGLNFGQWYDVAVTWKQATGEVRLYIDGKVDSTGTLKMLEKPLESATLQLGFAAHDFPAIPYFQGEITAVRFYQRLLKDSEVAKPAMEQPNEDRLIGHWEMGSLSQDQVVNKVGKSGNGRVVRAAAQLNQPTSGIVAGISGDQPPGLRWDFDPQEGLQLKIPPGPEPLRFTLATMVKPEEPRSDRQLAAKTLTSLPVIDLEKLTTGGPARWPEELTTKVIRGDNAGPFAADVLTLPGENPWFCQMRLTGLDFFPAGDRMAVCTWDGDVWLVSGLHQLAQMEIREPQLKWRRIASGLFQPLGLLIVDDQIHLTCRDQLVILRDLNGDGETDFYECLNNDHQVTEHFHEFAMGLQRDKEGNFYYAKSARHALPAIVPHHGTLLRVSPDGERTDILATGFRAANGVCLNPDGTFFVTDQEGHWNPKNRINWVHEGGFYGNMFGYHDIKDSSDSAMEPPLCWITNAFDRSPAELLWVTSDSWGPLKGSLLNLSYGTGKVFVVPHERRGKVVQGGMTQLPLAAFPTGIQRGRFHPQDGQLYACGMFAWAGNAVQPGGLYRIRYTGKPVSVATGLETSPSGVSVTLSDAVDPKSAVDVRNYSVKTWSLRRTENYGSDHHDEKVMEVTSARLSADGKTIQLGIPKIQPTWCMEISYSLKSLAGEPLRGVIHNTIHKLQD